MKWYILPLIEARARAKLPIIPWSAYGIGTSLLFDYFSSELRVSLMTVEYLFLSNQTNITTTDDRLSVHVGKKWADSF